MRAPKAQVSLRICADSPELLLPGMLMNVQYFRMAIDKRHLRICNKHQISGYPHVVAHLTKCKEKGKDQESIQSSTTLDRVNHMGN